MDNSEYAAAYREILEILKYVSLDYYDRIPKKLINLFRNNADMNYNFLYNPEKTLDEQNVSMCAKEILAIIYTNYWSQGIQKNKIKAFQDYQKNQIEKEKQERYSLDTLFNQGSPKDDSEIKNVQAKKENLPTEYREGTFYKIKKFLKKFFH